MDVKRDERGTETNAGPRVDRNIVFKETAEKGLMLNVYRSATKPDGPRPLIVYTFGGAWRVGNRNQVESWMNLLELTDSGYIVAGLDYRLSFEATFPAQIEDVWDGIRWLIDRAAEYGIDPDRIGIIGPSAGGHLAALVGATSGSGRFGSERVQAVVDFYGPTDFLQMDAHSISDELVHDAANSPESTLVGGEIQRHPERVAQANPITYVTADAPPFLIVHGKRDPLVPHHQSVLLAEALRRHGVHCEFETVENGGHGGFESKEWLERVHTFFDHNLR